MLDKGWEERGKSMIKIMIKRLGKKGDLRGLEPYRRTKARKQVCVLSNGQF